ncbi:hypothetical protein ACXIVK_36655 [Paraburkholderia caledonica]
MKELGFILGEEQPRAIPWALYLRFVTDDKYQADKQQDGEK